ncbi:hypothetical protein BY458DRAFT_469062 [Sporodiniella umbellata]|nr:hypothetical protein BY458DRAFT_469062 [Sporodiniella umbellata]
MNDNQSLNDGQRSLRSQGSFRDPYQSKNRHLRSVDQRAYSYLPYSHHSRDPSRPIEPVYMDEDLLSIHSPGQQGPVGSLLQDNIGMEPTEVLPPPCPALDFRAAAPAKRKRGYIRSEWNLRKLILLGFVLASLVSVTWYFVWPRIPTLEYAGAYLDEHPTLTNISMSSVWNVNFTVLNNENWIPTHIHNLAVSAVDSSTGVTLGHGNSHSLTLIPKSINQVITVPIHINYTAKSLQDPTFQDLSSSCSIVNQDLSSPSKQTFDVNFHILFSIQGIVWHPLLIVNPSNMYFQCPTSTE